MENTMSEIYENEEQEATIDSFLDAVRRQNLAQSRAHFDNLMNQKLGDALDQEKAAIATTLYNPPVEEEEDDLEDLSAEEEVFDEDEEEVEVEDAIEDAFEDDEEEAATP